MKLTSKGRYAVTAMLDLAFHYDSGVVTLAEIAYRQGLSLSYLEQLFARLRQSGLVESVRGPGGGYNLALDPSQISVAEIVATVNGSMNAPHAPVLSTPQADAYSLTDQIWEDLSLRIYDFLKGISLADLIARPHLREIALRQDEWMRAAG